MRKLLHAQMDLFAVAMHPIEIARAERQKALALLQALLSEAVMNSTDWQSNNSKEADDEQDHR